MTTRVLIADDNAFFRDALTTLLARLPGIDVIGWAGDAAQAAWKTTTLLPDVVLLDTYLPDATGAEAVRQLLAIRPSQAICALAVTESESCWLSAVCAGARGYIVKHDPPAAFSTALTAVAAGGVAVTPRLAQCLLNDLGQRMAIATVRQVPPLTLDERQVLSLVAAGRDTRRVARRLHVPEPAVSVHLRNALDKMQRLWRDEGDRGDDGLFGSGVPRRPSPGGLRSAAEAKPEREAW